MIKQAKDLCIFVLNTGSVQDCEDLCSRLIKQQESTDSELKHQKVEKSLSWGPTGTALLQHRAAMGNL